MEQPPGSADGASDIVARQGKKIFVFELKASSEARKDRAINLISQAILEARRAAGEFSNQATPVAVLAFGHVSDSLAEDVNDFALRNAPDVGVGVIDTDGFRCFIGHVWKFSMLSGRAVPNPLETTSCWAICSLISISGC